MFLSPTLFMFYNSSLNLVFVFRKLLVIPLKLQNPGLFVPKCVPFLAAYVRVKASGCVDPLSGHSKNSLNDYRCSA